MQRVFGFILAFKEYVALIVYVAICLTLMAMSRNTDMQPVRAFTTAVVGAVQSTYAWIPNPIRLSRENDELRARAIELASEVGRLRRAQVENDELRKMLGIAPRQGWMLRPAEVVGKTTTFERNMMTISLGAKDGVAEGMAVITDAGLVGRVFSTSQNFALVEMLFNSDFRAAAKIARTRVEGIVAWDGGPTMVMRNVPKALDVQIGDLVVTSEYSTFFPSEVPIGKIIKIEPEPNTLFRRISVDPTANVYRVEHVYVVMKDAALERERIELEEQARKEAEEALRNQ
jgi:rod shape-determining protein MreC